MHPMATVTKIDPDEIPEVSNKYLMRSDSNTAKPAGDGEEDDGRRRDNRPREQKGFGWSKKRVPLSRSGRTIKGRGHFVGFFLCRVLLENGKEGCGKVVGG